ncbi:MAG TPA: hypothetical protein PLQ88_33625, partial [Blastocatellia bacterium]|nr:hypothetical protein [Blastocatellia bacterium]
MKFKEQSNMLTWETMQGRIKPLAVLLLLLCGAVPALAGTIYVNSTNDGIGAGCPSANCTLRDALLKAATTGDVIELQAGAT